MPGRPPSKVQILPHFHMDDKKVMRKTPVLLRDQPSAWGIVTFLLSNRFSTGSAIMLTQNLPNRRQIQASFFGKLR